MRIADHICCEYCHLPALLTVQQLPLPWIVTRPSGQSNDGAEGVIWVNGVNGDGVLAFTEFGIENLTHLIELHKEDLTILKRRNSQK